MRPDQVDYGLSFSSGPAVLGKFAVSGLKKSTPADHEANRGICRHADIARWNALEASQLENVVMLCPGSEYVNMPFDTVTFANCARFWLAEVLNGVSELTVAP